MKVDPSRMQQLRAELNDVRSKLHTIELEAAAQRHRVLVIEKALGAMMVEGAEPEKADAAIAAFDEGEVSRG